VLYAQQAEAVMISQLLKGLLIFPIGLLGGLIASTLMWTVVIFYYHWHATRSIRKLGYGGPVAIAGGWQYLVQLPWMVVLISVAFGLGFYLAVSWAARHP
jgi:uncharacterized membrane protein